MEDDPEDQKVHPAVILRAAAQIARGIAEMATPGPWAPSGHSVIDNRDIAIIEATRADACHIGLWNPVVALSCARWLEACADNWPPQLIVTATPTAAAERREALATARELLKAAS